MDKGIGVVNKIARKIAFGSSDSNEFAKNFVSAFELDHCDPLVAKENNGLYAVSTDYIQLNIDIDIIYQLMQDWQGYVEEAKFVEALKDNLSDAVNYAMFEGSVGAKCSAERIDSYMTSRGVVHLFKISWNNVSKEDLDKMDNYIGIEY